MKNTRILEFDYDPHQSLNFPLNWDEIFKRKASLAVEVGCGNGEFLVEWAKSRPDWNFVGVELSLSCGERLLSRIHQNRLQNVRLIRDDARFVLRELFAKESVAQVMLNFPDPWPKEKHKSRRLIEREFVQTLGTILEKHGIFELFTDQKWYAEKALMVFRESRAFKISGIIDNPERCTSTKYERKWKELFRQIYYVQAENQKKLDVKRIVENLDMPHYFVDKKVSSKQIYLLNGLECSEENRVFKVKEIFERPAHNVFLFRIVAVDDGYMQTFFILVAPHGKGFIIKIDTGFQPYRTPAVKWAVEEIGRLLTDQ
ncbi:MAG: tRNA (guanosine(46)-N7)-methyltransferase TrmB [Calditrichia bacterium]|nr:tRNA (guanosine(46)-N7)-methyltransferase TrmB [Calditrichia bacterium]